jgi:biotin carboxyl carrier protein
MKMENVIKSPTSGIIGKIHISEKASVEKNEILLTFR